MEVAEAVVRCVKQLEDVERRQAARLAREQAREAERLKAREHALQQLKERQEPALKPLLPDGWTARWSAENTQWYFIKQGGE
eukprot:COSAG04_NODE_9542_length_854_cov_1.002649_1_plen_81_part_10